MKILLVDDITAMREIVKQMLIHEIFSTESVKKNKILEGITPSIMEAKNGYEAIEIFKISKPDIVILDMHMPNITGIEVSKKILEISKNTQITMLTSDKESSVVVEAFRAGVRHFIIKPITSEKLIEIVFDFLK